MKVRIFIEIIQAGGFQNCQGKYAIVLETTIDGFIHTRTHFGGCHNSTPPRVQLLAVVDALSYMQEPSQIEIHISSPYVAVTHTKVPNVTKNKHLWQQYYFLSTEHDIEIINEKKMNTPQP